MQHDWEIDFWAFGHYCLRRKREDDVKFASTNGIYFRSSELDDLIDVLEDFKHKQNSGN